ncbi:catalase-related domain-containing protein [Evansella halocellulosilytica]|uniref:catalase-related domain-containing protein n=1 Tax=Evansella halocellulosilytica TaxID=2011013 RepID=UPI000BB98D75|nr:catalase-related domain-containing protein [Evansella halocellulosilytica]
MVLNKNPENYYAEVEQGNLKREKIPKENNFGQAGETYRRFTNWEKDELVSNLGVALVSCRKEIQDKMISMLTECDEEYGLRVADKIQEASDQEGTKMDQAVEPAEEQGHISDPY